MELVGFVLYVVVCGTLAWLLATALTRRAKAPWVFPLAVMTLAPMAFFLPLADEIIGSYQFERLCEEAKDVKIYGTIPVGEELYTPEGKWRLGLIGAADFVLPQKERESFRLEKIVDSYVRWDLGPLMPPEVPAAISIQRFERKLYDARSGRLLAEWRQYGAAGGWFSRKVVFAETPLIVRPSCMPDIILRSEIHQMVLKFSKPSEATK